MNYTLTLHVNLATVTAGDPGHGWIGLSDGVGNPDSYGFYPQGHGLETLIGADTPGEAQTGDGGRLSDPDARIYPDYSQTIPISESEYKKIKDFSDARVNDSSLLSDYN